ncbi:hypothetical protein [Nocardioides sp.]|uniref:hypothetical protein n=1 Tax=Nocardioides sp. TaxID=35761 RepID=UPI0027342299|nr:hypothetical protein [Nocardioides sp.]MDP3893205.1 hypothetical protein [Nocardioides sp.]
MTRAPLQVARTTRVAAPAGRVWDRVTTFEGINHELMPLMRMVLPRRYAGSTVDDLEPGQRVGRVWILYLGFLPLDFDDLTIAELEPGRRFLERSRMATMRTWQHERVVEPLPEGDACTLTDRLTFEPRMRLLDPLLRRVVTFVFAHRHRRLLAHFG